ncbi:Ig-like domain-containing protein [Pseudoalteromonas sp. T1lg65]|uniref:Ig-like domain-containing protein n=1 Tax=Pseudoalteromonas sp. T1lg65 TaxID=2077101 RepID=UPI003F78E514
MKKILQTAGLIGCFIGLLCSHNVRADRNTYIETTEHTLYLIDKDVQSAAALIKHNHLPSTAVRVANLTDSKPQQGAVDAIHLVSHGGPGWLQLENKKIYQDTPSFKLLVEQLDALLSEHGVVYIYGCDVAKDQKGRAFINALSRDLGHTVYASIDKTGNSESGGDWLLEYGSSSNDERQIAQHIDGFLGVLAAPNDVTFQNGGPALLSNPVTFDGVTYSHDLPATGKMARYNDSVTGNDNFGTADGQNTDNILLYHMSDGGTLDAPTGDVDFRFKTSSGDEFKLVSMEAGGISNEGNAVSNSINYQVTITGYRDSASVVSDTIDFQTSDSANSVTYTKNSGYNDGVLTFDSEWQNIDEVRFTTSGKSTFVTFVHIDTIDFEAAVSDSTPPSVNALSISGSPNSNDSSITYTITFDESVANVSTDDFAVTTVSGNATATVSGVSSSSGSSMDITISSISGTGSLRLDLNANTNIVDALGNGNNNNGYVASFNGAVHTVDRDAPTVSNVTSSASDGTYKIGDSLALSVIFTESVTVTGTPTITLETGSTDRAATYTSGSGTDTLNFTYTVQSGDVSNDLAYNSVSALALAGGSISDAAGNAAVLTLATPGDANSLSANKALVIDGIRPQVSSVSSTSADGTYVAGNALTITVTFDESVTVTGTPSLTMETGTSDTVATYTSGSGSATLNFTYTVQSGDSSSDLDYFSTSALALSGGSIIDSSGNAASLTLPSPGATNSLSANKALVIDGVPPSVTSVSASTANGSYKVGDVITLTTTFSEVVTVSGTPTLTLETGATDRAASYSSGSGSTTLSFTYVVQSGDISADLAYVSTAALALNGGAINDAAGNSATLTLAVPGASNSLSANKALAIDGVVPTLVSANSVPAAGSYGHAAGDNIVLQFSENIAFGSGSIMLINSATSVVIENFDVTTGQGSSGGSVSVSTNTLVINPGLTLGAGQSYAVQIAPTAVADIVGNAFAGINDNTSYVFTVAANVVLSVDNSSITENAGVASVTVALQNSSGSAFTAPADVVMQLSFSGTATGSGTDYSLSGGISGTNVTINTGSTSQAFTVTGVDDSPTVDDNETVIVDIDVVTSGNAVELNTQSVTITLVENNAPTITGTPSTSVFQNAAYNFTPQASDLDGDTLTFSISNQPSWANFNTSTGSLSGVPSNSDVGTTTGVLISVSDGTTSASLSPFNIEVVNVNDAPTISGTPVTSVLAGTAYSFSPQAADVDGDTLSFSINSQPSWLSFNSSTGELSGTPETTDAGTTSNIIITVTDGSLSASLAAFDLTVTRENTAPVATSQTINVNEDTSISIVGKAEDAEQDTLSFALVSQPANGVLTTSSNGWTYLPNTNFNGQDSFSYTASDQELTSEEATVTINVTAVNDLPDAQDDVITLVQNESDSYTLSVLANDIDVDGDSLSIEGVKASIGSVSIVGGELSYIAPAGFSGEVQFGYVITDGNKGRDSASVDLQITGPNDGQKPVLTVPQDLELNALGLYTKVDLGVATAVDSLGNPVPVSLVDQIPIFPSGVNKVYWQATDSNGLQTIDKQTVTIHPIISLSKDQVVAEGNDVTVQVLLNGNAPSYPVNVSYSVSGTADNLDHSAQSGEVIITNGTSAAIQFSIFSDDISESEESIEISLTGAGNFGSKNSTTIRIREGNIAPTVDLSVTQQQEERLTVSQSGGVVVVQATAKDVNQQDLLSISWTSTLTSQTETQSSFTFDPSNVPSGIYPVTAAVSDNGVPALSAKDTVYIEVVETLLELGSEDSDGDLIPDEVEGYADSDGDGIADFLDAIAECNVVPERVQDQVAYLAEGDPGVCLRKGAVAAQNSRGGLQLGDEILQGGLPADNEVSNVGGVFDYIAYGLPEPGQTYRLVLPQALPIPANAVYRKYTEAEGWRDFVENANNKVFSSAGETGFCPPPGGTVWQEGLTEGHWCIQLEVEDGGPNDADGEVNGTIVDPSGVGVYLSDNQVPIANEDTYSMQWNSTETFDVLANDTDADGDTLSITQASTQFGVVEVTADQQLRYTPSENFVGENIISYGITDSQGGTGFSSVTVTVTGNQPPKAQNDSAQTAHRTLVTVDVLTNDSDPDGDELTITFVSANRGEAYVNDGKTISYMPNVGFVGEDTITYRISDGNGGTAQALVIVSVAENQAPIANPNRAAVDNISSILIDVLSNDTDPEADALTVIAASAEIGTVVVVDNGLLRYTPKSGYIGTDSVNYTIQDTYGAQAKGTVSVKITKPVSDGSGGGLFWILLLGPLALLRRKVA